MTALWANIVIPLAAKREGLGESLKPLVWFLACILPALILLLVFVKASGQTTITTHVRVGLEHVPYARICLIAGEGG